MPLKEWCTGCIARMYQLHRSRPQQLKMIYDVEIAKVGFICCDIPEDVSRDLGECPLESLLQPAEFRLPLPDQERRPEPNLRIVISPFLYRNAVSGPNLFEVLPNRNLFSGQSSQYSGSIIARAITLP